MKCDEVGPVLADLRPVLRGSIWGNEFLESGNLNFRSPGIWSPYVNCTTLSPIIISENELELTTTRNILPEG